MFLQLLKPRAQILMPDAFRFRRSDSKHILNRRLPGTTLHAQDRQEGSLLSNLSVVEQGLNRGCARKTADSILLYWQGFSISTILLAIRSCHIEIRSAELARKCLWRSASPNQIGPMLRPDKLTHPSDYCATESCCSTGVFPPFT